MLLRALHSKANKAHILLSIISYKQYIYPGNYLCLYLQKGKCSEMESDQKLAFILLKRTQCKFKNNSLVGSKF